MTIAAARLGDMALLGLSAEEFNEIGRAIKKASPFQHTVTITHWKGGSGYLSNSPAYEEGGYEVQSSRFAPEGNVKYFPSRIRENSGVLGRLRSLTTSATIVFPVFSMPKNASQRCPEGPNRQSKRLCECCGNCDRGSRAEMAGRSRPVPTSQRRGRPAATARFPPVNATGAKVGRRRRRLTPAGSRPRGPKSTLIPPDRQPMPGIDLISGVHAHAEVQRAIVVEVTRDDRRVVRKARLQRVTNECPR
jgi:hypothetical protein